MHPRLVELLPEVALAAARDDRVHVFVGVIQDGTAADPGEAGADFIVRADDVHSVDAITINSAMVEHDPASLIVEVTGVDRAAVIAGQVSAIASGVRALVTTDVKATRRVTVMIEQVLNSPSLHAGNG